MFARLSEIYNLITGSSVQVTPAPTMQDSEVEALQKRLRDDLKNLDTLNDQFLTLRSQLAESSGKLPDMSVDAAPADAKESKAAPHVSSIENVLFAAKSSIKPLYEKLKKDAESKAEAAQLFESAFRLIEQLRLMVGESSEIISKMQKSELAIHSGINAFLQIISKNLAALVTLAPQAEANIIDKEIVKQVGGATDAEDNYLHEMFDVLNIVRESLAARVKGQVVPQASDVSAVSASEKTSSARVLQLCQSTPAKPLLTPQPAEEGISGFLSDEAAAGVAIETSAKAALAINTSLSVDGESWAAHFSELMDSTPSKPAGTRNAVTPKFHKAATTPTTIPESTILPDAAPARFQRSRA